MDDKYIDIYTFSDRLRRFIWNVARVVLFRPFALPLFHSYRNWILRLWGAKIDRGSIVHASSVVWAPWNLELGERSCLGPHTIIYNPGKIRLGRKAVVSQYAYLCTATHDYTSPSHILYWRDITIDDYAWIAARAFVGPGVHVREWSIVGACAVLCKDTEAWGIYAGNPARLVKKRTLKHE